MYIAHSLLGEPDQSKWEPLYSPISSETAQGHLDRVSKILSSFSKILTFDQNDLWREWGKYLGLWHDLGKYSQEFQHYIQVSGDSEENDDRACGKVDHSSAGAKWAIEHISPSPLGDLMAYMIAGHHCGLPNGVDLFQRRMKLRHPEWQSFAPKQLLISIQIQGLWDQKIKPFIRNEQKFGFATAMQIRMLFSCLVDADFLSTEAFMDKKRHEARPTWPNDLLARMSDMLEDKLAQLESNASNSIISKLRASIHHNCYDHGVKNPGVYQLNVPTGGGKTLSSLSFALKHAVQHGFPRIIYVIPYTSIIEQTTKEFRNVFAELSESLGYDCVLEHHSNIELSKETTHTKLISENWDAPLIVTTNVQFFESLFSNKTSSCRKVHRIAHSVVIFDEAQALPCNLLAPCMEAMKTLRRDYGNTLVLCTATQPALQYRDNFSIGWEEQEIQSLLGEKQESILEQKMRRVSIEHLGPLDNEGVIKHLLALHINSALLIVNTTRQSQDLFLALYERMPSNSICLHLSARMCPRHRSKVLEKVRSLLDKHKSVILVATKVIEAGVDISFPIVYRDQSGIDSLAQAAGRCNRHGEVQAGGVVYSFESSDYPIPPCLVDLKVAASVARDIRSIHPDSDMLAPDVIRRFFELYYTARGDQTTSNGDTSSRWDETGVLSQSCCQYGQKETFRSINFPEISKRFQIIPEGQHQIMIPWGIQGERIRRALQLQQKKIIMPNQKLFRYIQSYSITIYDQDWIALESEGRLESYANGLIYVLPTLDSYYDSNTGFLPMKQYDPNSLTYIS